MTRERLTYTFGPLERSGLLGGLGAGQAGVLAGAAVTAILVLDRAPTAAGAALAVIVLAVAFASVVLPVGGRPLSDWVPLALAFAWRRAGGGFRSPLPGSGAVGRPAASRRASAPPQLRGVGITDAGYRDRTMGVISDDRGRLLTAVLACRAGSFAMLDADAQERRLARWGQILAGAANGPVRRLQWIERTAPSQGDELARYLHRERDPAVPLRGTPVIDSYLELIDSTTRTSQEHEILLAVQVDARRAGRDPTACLIAEAERLARALEGAEVNVLGALSAERLARAVRTAFDPYARAELAALDVAASQDAGQRGDDPRVDKRAEPSGRGADSAWPLADREEWDRYVADGSEHATWWVSAWPRVPVTPMFMESVLARSPAVRTVAVTFEPVGAARSTREVEAQVTRDRADGELRRRFGQSETARQRQAREATARREAELAVGHGEVRMAGFVTVSGRDADELRAACAEVVEHAARSRLELRRMYGSQAEAFTFTLPLCRGLR